jgi:hypothetical protein
MKILTSLLLAVIFSLSASGQNAVNKPVLKDSAYIADFNKLRGLYVKRMESDSQKKMSALMTSFMKKAKFSGDANVYATEDGMIQWIRSNFDKTSFASIAEAEKEYQLLKDAFTAETTENADYYTLVKESVAKHTSAIVMDVMQNRAPDGKDPKESPEYAAAYAKLRALFIKQSKSASHLKYESLRREFTKKANFNYKTNTLTYPETMLDWVKKNLAKTSFTSSTQAEMEWGLVELAEEAHQKENKEYYDYKSETRHKFGPDMHRDIMLESMAP